MSGGERPVGAAKGLVPPPPPPTHHNQVAGAPCAMRAPTLHGAVRAALSPCPTFGSGAHRDWARQARRGPGVFDAGVPRTAAPDATGGSSARGFSSHDARALLPPPPPPLGRRRRAPGHPTTTFCVVVHRSECGRRAALPRSPAFAVSKGPEVGVRWGDGPGAVGLRSGDWSLRRRGVPPRPSGGPPPSRTFAGAALPRRMALRHRFPERLCAVGSPFRLHDSPWLCCRCPTVGPL